MGVLSIRFSGEYALVSSCFVFPVFRRFGISAFAVFIDVYCGFGVSNRFQSSKLVPSCYSEDFYSDLFDLDWRP